MSSHRKRFSMNKLVTGTESGDWEGPPGYQAALEATECHKNRLQPRQLSIVQKLRKRLLSVICTVTSDFKDLAVNARLSLTLCRSEYGNTRPAPGNSLMTVCPCLLFHIHFDLWADGRYAGLKIHCV